MELLLEMAPCFEHLQNKQKPQQEGIHVAEVNPLAGAGKLERYRKVLSRVKIILGRSRISSATHKLMAEGPGRSLGSAVMVGQTPKLVQGDEEPSHRAVPGWHWLHPQWQPRCLSPESPGSTLVPLPAAGSHSLRTWKEVVATGIRQGSNA